MTSSGHSNRVIVTRPAHDAAVWVARLQQCGVNAQALPLIEIVAISSPADTSALQQAIARLHTYAACMFVSPNAVAHFVKVFIESNMPTAPIEAALVAPVNIANYLPGHLRFLAPGPGTVTGLLAAGIPASRIDAPPPEAAQFDSEALWQVVGTNNWRDARVLIVRGKGDAADTSTGAGRDWLASQWRASGATVEVVSSYERRVPCLLPAQIEVAKSASHDGTVWLFSSSEAVINLTSQAGLKAMSWQGARAIATHPRIEAAVHAAGWGVVQPSRPNLPDIIQALASIESMAI